MQTPKYNLHIISHTHWDREWHHSFQDFRYRLVEFVDYLLDLMENNDGYRYFHLDGQTVILEDYLEIKPENEDRLRNLIKEGRILIGPWYVQPDEFLVSGEALIRNMLLGHKISSSFGRPMKAGYLPDAFGHNSQMPQIFKGFGIDNIVLFRGITSDYVKAEFIWEGSDGSRIIAIKMSDDTAYSNFFYELKENLTPDGSINYVRLEKDIRHMIGENSNQATTKHLLCMDGVDHIFPNPKTPEIIRWINENMDNAEAVHTTLPEYISVLKNTFKNGEYLCDVNGLEVRTGELRISNRRWRLQGLFAGVLSSRMYLKLANHYAQLQIEKWAEPAATLAWVMGGEYPHSYLWRSWKYLLKNHAHDSICGCSIDQVHDDMVYRFEQSKLISNKIIDKSLEAISEKIDTSDIRENENAFVAYNPLSWHRTEVIRTFIDFPSEKNITGFKIYDSKGVNVPYQIINREDTRELLQKRHEIPQQYRINRYKIAFMADNILPLGYCTYIISYVTRSMKTDIAQHSNAKSMENEYLRVDIAPNGTFTIDSKETGRIFSGLMRFEDGGDAGDGYNYIKPAGDKVYTSQSCDSRIDMVESGPYITTFKVNLLMHVPECLAVNKEMRSDELVGVHITYLISLLKNSRRVDITTKVVNTAKDHRLRVCFPTGINASVSRAESQFDIIERNIAIPDCSDWKEPLPATHPQLTFVGISDDRGGFVVINKGLPEYEVKDDGQRTIAITLLRCVGGGVGKPEEMVKGQCQGEYVFEYSVMPYDGRWNDVSIWREGYNRNVPMRITRTGKHRGMLSKCKSFISISNDNVVLTALKKCESRNSIILRLLNISNADVNSIVGMPFPLAGVYRSNLNEEREEELKIEYSDNYSTVSVRFGAKMLCTLEVILCSTKLIW